MSVTSIEKDFERLTLTLVADFDAPVERVWQLWADPRQLERWWGPPSHPATMHRHDLVEGGEVTYVLTGQGDDRHHGWWRITAVDPPTSLEFIDGFADHDGTPLADLPTTTVRVQLLTHEGRTRMEMRSTFDSLEQMEQLVNMGAVEGMQAAIDQIDALLVG